MIPKNTDWAEDWRNITFEGSVRVIGFTRGQSAANVDVISVTKDQGQDQYFTIFLIDFFDMLENGDIVDMVITGTFEVKKRGRDFGIRLKDTPKWDKPSCSYFDSHRPIPRYI